MSRISFWLPALLGLVSLGALAAPEPSAPALSLREAAQRTLAHNPDLALQPFHRATAQAGVDAAGLRPAPEAGAQVENLLGTGRRSGIDAAESTFTITQLLEPGGLRARRLDAARERLGGLGVEESIARLDVLAEVGRRFVHVASDQKQPELTGLATELAGGTLREVQRRVQAARSPVAELHRARIVLARAEVEQEHAEHELLTSRRKLAAMWGAREPDFERVRADLFVLPQVADYEALLGRIAASPDFLRYATETRQREAELRLAEAKARAPLTLSAGLRHLREGDDVAFVAGVSVPLFAARRAQPAIAEARAAQAQVDAERAAAQVKAEASLYELVQELRHGITEAELLRDRVLPEMEAALKATEYAWQRGRYGWLELSEAQRERIAVQRALIEAAANARLFEIEIERLTGVEVGGEDSAPRDEGDHRHAGEAERHAEQIRPDRADAVHRPQPEQRGADVDAAVGRVDPAAGLRVQGEQPHEQREAQRRRQQQPGAAPLPEPEPGQVAADDLGQRRQPE